MKPSLTRSKLCRGGPVAALLWGMAWPVLALPDLSLHFTPDAVVTSSQDAALTSYLLPVGPFQAGTMATTRAEGRMTQTAWRLDQADMSTLGLMQDLRAQIAAAGFEVVFECEAQDCGGFDFRYGTEVLPEPEMHVDLGDFRFLAASREDAPGKEYLSLLVSRSPLDGYVQLTRIGALPPPEPGLTASTKTPGPMRAPPIQPAPDPAPDSGGIGDQLAAGVPVVLEDLVFASGAASLQAGDYPSLQTLAAWLKANPDKTVSLVGHTDASGSLAANIALSKRRAESVRQALLAEPGIAAAQVSADGVGSLAPRASNLDADGRTRNRRVEVFLTATP